MEFYRHKQKRVNVYLKENNMVQLFILVLFHVLTILFYSVLFQLYRRKGIISIFTCIDVIYCTLTGLGYYFILNHMPLVEGNILNVLVNAIYLPIKVLTVYLTQTEIISATLFLFILLITIVSFRIWLCVKYIECDFDVKFTIPVLPLTVLTVFLPIGLFDFNALF